MSFLLLFHWIVHGDKKSSYIIKITALILQLSIAAITTSTSTSTTTTIIEEDQTETRTAFAIPYHVMMMMMIMITLMILYFMTTIPWVDAVTSTISTILFATTTRSQQVRQSIELLFREQAGGGKGARRRKRNQGKQSPTKQNSYPVVSNSSSSDRPPSPMVDFDAIQQISLVHVKDIQDLDVDDPKKNDNQSQQHHYYTPATVLAKIQFSNCSSNSNNNSNNNEYLDPRQLHQTVDYRLWMTLRDKVDVSASQFSVVLGTNTYFTNRQAYLQQKVQGIPTKNFVTDVNSTPSNLTSTIPTTSTMSKACAWGIRMEPSAYALYQQVVAQESHFTTTVHPTGMHILTIPRNCHHNDDDDKKDYNSQRPHSYFTLGASPDGIVVEELRQQQYHHPTTTSIMNNDGIDNDPNTTTFSTPSQTPTTTSSIGLLEIKCLWGRRHNKRLPPFDYCPRRYFDQIQGQLAICDKPWCDLMLYIPPSSNQNQKNNKYNNISPSLMMNQKNANPRSKTNSRRKKKMNQVMTKTGGGREEETNFSTATGPLRRRPRHGPNYSIVRVYRNETYWNETLLPALLQFCQQVSHEQQQQQQQQK
jgi:hypothetical protein